MIAEPMIEVTLRVANSLKEVAAEAWDACANPVVGRDHGNGADLAPRDVQENTLEDRYNPFISYDFLSSLELSQSVRTRGGWQPLHLLAEDSNGTLVGAVPCYAKTHSQGEYVFDHGWAEAYERAGGSYYPKLQVAVPFTTVVTQPSGRIETTDPTSGEVATTSDGSAAGASAAAG